MKVSIRRTGGFAGLIDELGSTEVPPAVIQRLKADRTPEHLGADLFRYEVTVENGANREVLIFRDNDPPDLPNLRDLIHLVQSNT